MSDPRAYTVEEIRDELIDYIWALIRYWGGHGGSNVPTESSVDDRLSGLAHSILVILDGCGGLPAFGLQVQTHPDDEEFSRENDENWYPNGAVIEDMLHEHLYRDDLRQDRREQSATQQGDVCKDVPPP